MEILRGSSHFAQGPIRVYNGRDYIVESPANSSVLADVVIVIFILGGVRGFSFFLSDNPPDEAHYIASALRRPTRVL